MFATKAAAKHTQQQTLGRTKPTSAGQTHGIGPAEHQLTSDLQRYLGNSYLQAMATAEQTQQEDTVPVLVGTVLRRPGQPLDGAVRTAMESLFASDFSQVRVHTDTEAAESARSVQARAYTLGQDVVFGARQYQPYTPAGRALLVHELVHVVQQSATCGGPATRPLRISSPTDAAERAAEGIAHSLSAGIFAGGGHTSQGYLADALQGGIRPTSAGTIQRDMAMPEKNTQGVALQPAQEVYKLPANVPYQIRLVSGNPAILVRREWLLKADKFDPNGAEIRAPNAFRELLEELQESGIFPRLSPGQITELAPQLRIYGPIPGQKIFLLELTLEALEILGPTGTDDFQWLSQGNEFALIIRKHGQGGNLLEISKRALAQLTGHTTGKDLIPSERDLIAEVAAERLAEQLEKTVPKTSKAYLGHVEIINRKFFGGLFTEQAWTALLKKTQQSGQQITPQSEPADKQGSRAGPDSEAEPTEVSFDSNISPQDKARFWSFMKKLAWDKTQPGPKQDAYLHVSEGLIKELKSLNASQEKALLETLKQAARRSGKALTATIIEMAISDIKFETSYEKLGQEKPRHREDTKPVLDRPVKGAIINRSGMLHFGEKAQFFFKTRYANSALEKSPAFFRVPKLAVDWTITPEDKPNDHKSKKNLTRQHTWYIDTPAHTPDYFEYTFSEADQVLFPKDSQADPKKGHIFTIHARVYHNYYRPAYFAEPVEVKTEAERIAELKAKAFAAMGEYLGQKHDFELSWFEENLNKNSLDENKYEIGKKFYGRLPANFARLSFAKRTEFISKNRQGVEALIKRSRSAAIIEYARDYLETLAKAEKTLKAEKDKGYIFFETRATFLSREPGINDATLHLLTNVGRSGDTISVRIHDYTKLAEPVHYTFTGEASTFEAALEKAFVKLTKSYPPGRIALLAEHLDDHDFTNRSRATVGFELDTGTTWKDIKSVIYHPVAQVGVNILGTVVMIFVPVTAPFLFPMLVAYNTVDTLDDLEKLRDKGLLGNAKIATGLASIALDLLPYVGRAKVFLKSGKKAWYILEGIDLAGQQAIMTIDGLEMVEQVRNQYVLRLVKLQERITDLESKNPSHPELRKLRADHDKLVTTAQVEGLKTFSKMLAQDFLLLGPQAFKHLTGGVKWEMDALIDQGLVRHDPNIERPFYDPQSGEIVVNKDNITPADLETLRTKIAEQQADGGSGRPPSKPTKDDRDFDASDTTQGRRGESRPSIPAVGSGQGHPLAMTAEELTEFAGRILQRQITSMSGEVHFYGDWHEYVRVFRASFPDATPPGAGYYNRITGHLHISQYGNLLTALHETIHRVAHKRFPRGRDTLGRFLNEGITEAIVRRNLGKRAGVHSYDRHVQFVKILQKVVGKDTLEKALLDGEFRSLWVAVRRALAGDELGTAEFFALLRRVGPDVDNDPAFQQASRILGQMRRRQRRSSTGPGAHVQPGSDDAVAAATTAGGGQPRRVASDDFDASDSSDGGGPRKGEGERAVTPPSPASRRRFRGAGATTLKNKPPQSPPPSKSAPPKPREKVLQDAKDRPGDELKRSSPEDPKSYSVREYFQTSRGGKPEERYYAHATFNDGIIDLDFRLRRRDIEAESGFHRSSQLRGREEFNKVLQHFKRHHGAANIRGIRGDWSEADNLQLFNRQFHEHLASGLSWDAAVRQAALETRTGRWAREAGFTKVRVETEQLNTADTVFFEHISVVFHKGAGGQDKAGPASPSRSGPPPRSAARAPGVRERRAQPSSVRRAERMPASQPLRTVSRSKPQLERPPVRRQQQPRVEERQRSKEASVTLQRLNSEIKGSLEQGAPIAHPHPSRVQQAKKTLEASTARTLNDLHPSGVEQLTKDVEVLVRQMVADARVVVSLNKNKQPLTYTCMKNACGLGRDISAASLASFVTESGIPIQLHRFQAATVFDIAKNKHGFLVVTFQTEPPIRFIVDPTFGQFINPRGAEPLKSRFSAQGLLDDPVGARFARDLIRDGFIPLDGQTAHVYAKALMGSDYAGDLLDRKASELGKRLFSGEKALTEEIIGAQGGPLPAGAQRGPITRTSPELAARIEKQQDEIEDVEGALELIEEYQARAAGDPQLQPIVEDLQGRLKNLLQNEQTRASPPAVQAPSVTPRQPETAPSRIPSGAVETKETGRSSQSRRLTPREQTAQEIAQAHFQRAFVDQLGAAGQGTMPIIGVQGVEFHDVKVSLRSKELRVGYFGIENVSAPRGYGRLMQEALEQAVVRAARQTGARTARVFVEMTTNPKWREFLSSRGYVKYLIESPGMIQAVLSKVFTL